MLCLQDEVKEVVKLQPVAYLSDAISLANTIEEAAAPKNFKTYQERQPWNCQPTQPQPFRRNLTNTSWQQNDNTTLDLQQSKTADGAKRPIIPKANDTIPVKRATNPFQRTMLGKCYRCEQQGHLSQECPHEKPLLFKIPIWGTNLMTTLL